MTVETVTPLSLIGDRNFRNIWIGGALGWVMRWLEMLAIGVFTFELTGSALMVALITMVRTIPMLLFGAFTGAIADGLDRRLMLLAGMGFLALTSAVLAVLAITDAIAFPASTAPWNFPCAGPCWELSPKPRRGRRGPALP